MVGSPPAAAMSSQRRSSVKEARAESASLYNCCIHLHAQLARKPAFFVLNNCRASSPLADEAADALGDYGLPLVPVRIDSRVSFIKSLADGKGVMEHERSGSAAAEIAKLYANVIVVSTPKARNFAARRHGSGTSAPTSTRREA